MALFRAWRCSHADAKEWLRLSNPNLAIDRRLLYACNPPQKRCRRGSHVLCDLRIRLRIPVPAQIKAFRLMVNRSANWAF